MIRLLHLPRLPAPLWAVMGFVVLCFSISSDSIDMDEAQTWDYAHLETFSEVVDELRSDANSEAQMPLGMISWWAWCRVFGTSEVAMRSINLVWAALALAALARIGQRISLPWLPMLCAVQPFVWYCMDHARTPVMQMAGGAVLFCGTVSALRESQFTMRNLFCLCGGAILLCGASMLGVIPLLAILIGVTAHGFWKRMPANRSAKITVIFTGLVLLLMALYYATTLARGAGGAKIWAVSPLNIAFVAYEFLGLQGLGPGRQTIRAIMKGFEGPMPLLLALPGILLMLACYGGVMASAFKSWLTWEFSTPRPSLSNFRVWLMAIGVPAQSVILLFLLASLVSFPFWGRHLAGAFPFWVTSVALAIHWSHQGLWRRAGRWFSAALIALLICGSLLIRFSPSHAKDNYRAAAQEALRLAAEGKSVWWVADYSGGEYYGLQLSVDPEPSPGVVTYAPNRAEIPKELPNVVIISRPENFDNLATTQNFTHANGFVPISRYQAFSVLIRPLGQP